MKIEIDIRIQNIYIYLSPLIILMEFMETIVYIESNNEQDHLNLFKGVQFEQIGLNQVLMKLVQVVLQVTTPSGKYSMHELSIDNDNKPFLSQRFPIFIENSLSLRLYVSRMGVVKFCFQCNPQSLLKHEDLLSRLFPKL